MSHNIFYNKPKMCRPLCRLATWHRGGRSVFCGRTFPVVRSTCRLVAGGSTLSSHHMQKTEARLKGLCIRENTD